MAQKILPPVMARAVLWAALVPMLGLASGFALADQSAGAAVAVRHYDIAPGSLDQVLGRFGRDSGVLVAIDPALTQGLNSQGLNGEYGERAALERLLTGSGLEAVAAPQGGYRLQRVPMGRNDGVSALAPVLVTAELDRAAAVYETPGSVAVVTREQMDRIPARSIGDVLADVPGVYSVGSRQGGGLSVNIRGMQDFGRVNVMIDGARQNYQQSGHGSNGSAYIDPELLAGVDVSKGPSSTTGGAAVIGGVVNFRTLEANDLMAADESYGGQVTATTGNNAFHFSGSAAVAARLGEDVDLIAAVSRRKLGSFEPGKHGGLADDAYAQLIWPGYILSQEYWSGLAKLGWQVAPGHHLKLSYLGFESRRDLSRESSANSRVRRDTLIGNYRWTPDNPHVDLAAALYYTRTRNSEQRDGSEQLGYGAYNVRYQTSTVGGSLENTARYDLGDYALSWRLGSEFFHDWTDPEAQSSDTSLSGQQNYNSVWFTGSTPEGKRTVASLFSEATLSYREWLELTAGLRYDWYGLEGNGKIMIGDIANPPGVRPGTTYVWTAFGVNRHASAVSPRFSAAFKPWEPVQLFASFGKGMRPPAITETLIGGAHPGNMMLYYPNPGLLEERATNWELGSNLILDGLLTPHDSFKLKAAWFENKVRNYMAMAVVKSPDGKSGEGTFAPRAYVNLDDPFRSRGLELQADYDAGVVFAGVSYTHMLVYPGDGGYDPFPLGSMVGEGSTSLGKPGDGNIGYMLPPRKMASLTIGTRLFERRLTLGSRMRWRSPQRYQISEQFQEISVANAANAQIVDLWASYEFSKALTLRMAVDNLTDRNYSEMSGGSYFLAPGRTISGTVSVRF
ncbi:TonB-dependent receptor [Kerstersia gyiorum]|uniref:Heme acquisition protein HasR n=2 Tax=Kerstersia gyiorum TaxID=206506 RepID=A0A4Q7N1K5_9BURK|nr:TonB-dependent receptor [Kerstersia gyiorum]KAB0544988.1 TonB-dependent hemoglobin/transferrin/lactoferrin family receptor [Kerstersia gyiorum]MCP1632250.1 heme acquisition protein HasR [Kerstersia gyiorum]MCP1635243.1 heme acquisition protein HasR [Kerstersia gyiorum]MCP1669830.1 heme acquisition protein HasR [Kerstersia gyiorum]MCP1677969.1 heme acquisition protein HasR [Kerstersia gyiorum]